MWQKPNPPGILASSLLRLIENSLLLTAVVQTLQREAKSENILCLCFYVCLPDSEELFNNPPVAQLGENTIKTCSFVCKRPHI